MPANIDQFSVYSAKIFDVLYDSFPIPTSLHKDSIIDTHFTLVQNDELKELKIKLDFAEIATTAGDKELINLAHERLPALRNKIHEIESKQQHDRRQQEKIFEGTLNFLISEQLLRELRPGGYQLSSKGFSHLNKIFEDGKLSDDRRSNIATLKAIFEKSADTSLQVVAGTAVSVMTRILGYS